MINHRDQLLRYGFDRARLPAKLAERALVLELDDAARAFIDAALDAPHGAWQMGLHRLLRPLLSDFDINGLLGTHPMHLLSTAQWQRLLGPRARGRLLDVGAGSGDVTAALAPLFDTVHTTELSWAMARRLEQRGFQCFRLDASTHPLSQDGFDVITCLNVIDRSDLPRTLLGRLARALAPDGTLVVATPLPLSPFVYIGGTTRDPQERLRCRASRWEDAAAELAEHELAALGLEPVSLSRAPYLSRGGRRRPLAVLDDAIFVCRRCDTLAAP